MADKPDVMKVWRDMPPKTFFLIDGETFQKNSATTAIHVSNPMLGEIYITPVQARAIKPFVPVTPAVTPGKPNPQPVYPKAPKDPEIFETEIRERKPYDPNFGATTITVTPADSVVEQAPQPPKGTGKKAKKKAPKITTVEGSN
jgi:hypothetical protein